MTTCRRRAFLLLMLGQVTLAAGATAGCGGSGGGNGGSGGGTPSPTAGATPTPTPTATPIPTTPPLPGVTAQVVGIGGGALTIPSLYEGQISVGASGAAILTQSTIGAQLHTVIDPNGMIRAAAITVPTGRAVTFDSRATAAALVFVTPGILTVDPTEAAARLAAIETLPAFTPLANYLLQNLPINSLESLAAQSALPQLLSNCIEEMVVALPTRAAAPAAPIRARRAATSRQSRASIADTMFSASWLSSAAVNGDPTLQALNGTWRWTSVVAQKLAGDGATVTGNPVALQFSETGAGLTASSTLLGALPAHSWSEFAGEIAAPGLDGVGTANAGIANDHATAILRLWVYGPGIPSTSADVPSAIDSLQDKSSAWGQSLLAYVVAPMLDLLLGGPAVLPRAPTLVASLWSRIESGVALDALVGGAVPPALTTEFGAALKSALAPLPPLVVPGIAALAPTLIGSTAYIETALASLIDTLMPAQFLQIATGWGSIPATASYDLFVSTVGIGIQ